MRRREFLQYVGVASISEILMACGSGQQSTVMPGAPSPVTSNAPPSRTFLPSLGGSPIYSFTSRTNGYLYQALNDAGILIDSHPVNSRDTENGNTPFSGNLITGLLISGEWQYPPNGFDFNINGREYYDPMTNDHSIISDYYQFPVRAGDSITITLPPKWRG